MDDQKAQRKSDTPMKEIVRYYDSIASRDPNPPNLSPAALKILQDNKSLSK